MRPDPAVLANSWVLPGIRQHVRVASELQRWRAKGYALGADDEALDALVAEVEDDSRRWPSPFDLVAELDRRLMQRYAELRERPRADLREAAMRVLEAMGEYASPAEVDRFAIWLESICESVIERQTDELINGVGRPEPRGWPELGDR